MSIHQILDNEQWEHFSEKGVNLKQGRNNMFMESKYNAALAQLQQEEQLNLEFANFLHNNILQDLLSLKNMMHKSARPDISERTLSNHLQHIFEKLDVSSSVEAVTKAIQLGYISPIC